MGDGKMGDVSDAGRCCFWFGHDQWEKHRVEYHLVNKLQELGQGEELKGELTW